MDDYSAEQRDLIAAAVEQARLDKGWGKEEAARHANISSITWKKVEDGRRVQTTKLRAVEIALGWGAGSMDRVARGRPLAVQDDDMIEQIRERGWADHKDEVIWTGFRQATQYAMDCEARGANHQLVRDFIGDAVVLLNEVGRVRAHPEASGLRGDLVPTNAQRGADTAVAKDDEQRRLTSGKRENDPPADAQEGETGSGA